MQCKILYPWTPYVSYIWQSNPWFSSVHQRLNHSDLLFRYASNSFRPSWIGGHYWMGGPLLNWGTLLNGRPLLNVLMGWSLLNEVTVMTLWNQLNGGTSWHFYVLHMIFMIFGIFLRKCHISINLQKLRRQASRVHSGSKSFGPIHFVGHHVHLHVSHYVQHWDEGRTSLWRAKIKKIDGRTTVIHGRTGVGSSDTWVSKHRKNC